MARRWVAALPAALVLLSAFPVAAQSIQVVAGAFPPFRYMDEQSGSVIGADADMVRQVFARVGRSAEVELLPFQRALTMVKDGKAPAIAALTRNAEREQFLLFSGAISTVQDVFFKRADQDITWKVLADLKPYRIGATKGYNYGGGFWDAALPNVDIIVGGADGAPEMTHLKKLVAGEIDLAVCEVSVCGHLIRGWQQAFARVVPLEPPLGQLRPFHLAFSKAHPDAAALLALFDKALVAFVEAGLHKPIFAKYGMRVELPFVPPPAP